MSAGLVSAVGVALCQAQDGERLFEEWQKTGCCNLNHCTAFTFVVMKMGSPQIVFTVGLLGVTAADSLS